MALVRSKANADLPGVDMVEGDARDEGTLTRALTLHPLSALALHGFPSQPLTTREFSALMLKDKEVRKPRHSRYQGRHDLAAVNAARLHAPMSLDSCEQ